MSTGSASLRARLDAARARPLLVGPSLSDIVLDEGESSLAFALRRAASSVVDRQRAIVDLGADLVLAPTSVTTAPALHATGQAYRAAALTAAAVDLTRDAVLAAGRPALVIGEVPTWAGVRGRTEAQTHVERLLTSAVDGLISLGDDLDTIRDVCVRGAEHRLPVIVEVSPAAALAAASVGATAVVIRDGDPAVLAGAVERVRAEAPGLPLGARLVVDCAPEEREHAQLAVAHAWSLLGTASLSLVGVGGRAALSALPAVVELSRASRTSLL